MVFGKPFFSFGGTWTLATLKPAWISSTADIASPDPVPIRLIHRGEGYATFHRKDRAKSEEPLLSVGAISTTEIGDTLPTITTHISEDSYFCINSTYRCGYSAVSSTGLPYPLRRKSDLKFLNALYTDIDCHDCGSDSSTLLQTVIDMIEAGKLPPPSIFVRSGRGMWLLWLLVPDNTTYNPPEARPEKVRLYGRVQKAIQKALSHIGADPNATDAARIMRVPGSLNTKAPAGYQRVQFFPVADSSGQVPFYTLPELAERFSVESRITALVPTRFWSSRTPTGFVDEKVRKARQAACRARWRYSLEDFEALRRLRGGFKAGHRTHSVFIFTRLLTCNRVSQSEIRRAVIKLAQECKPPLPLDKSLTTMRDALRYKKPLRGDTCLQKLGVTAEERPFLPHWCPPVKKLKKQEIAERRNIIRAEAAWLTATPSCSQMALILARRGIVVTTRTIANDYRAIGLRSGRPAGRPKQAHAGDDATRKREC